MKEKKPLFMMHGEDELWQMTQTMKKVTEILKKVGERKD